MYIHLYIDMVLMEIAAHKIPVSVSTSPQSDLNHAYVNGTSESTSMGCVGVYVMIKWK